MDDENFKIPTKVEIHPIWSFFWLRERSLLSSLQSGKNLKILMTSLRKMKKERKSTRRWENWGKKFLFEVSTLWSVVESGFFSYLISLKCSQNLQSLSLFYFFLLSATSRSGDEEWRNVTETRVHLKMIWNLVERRKLSSFCTRELL